MGEAIGCYSQSGAQTPQSSVDTSQLCPRLPASAREEASSQEKATKGEKSALTHPFLSSQ